MKTDFYQNAWNLLLKKMKPHFKNETFYNDHFLKAKFHSINDSICYITVENIFTKEVLNNDYKNKINEEFSNLINKKIDFEFILENEKENIDSKKIIVNDINEFNQEMSFDNYIVGNFNKDVYMAIKKILTNSNDVSINPLFIFGSTGVGKTHLLNALGVKYKEIYPNKFIKYINAEDFLRKAYISLSIGGIETEKFKESYSDVDLLLIDDIQFFTNKDKLNEIFFNIFNDLVKRKKYVIMTSDKIPQELKIDSRMISRFNSGLTMQIPKPDIETIKEIIIQKVKNSNIEIPFSNPAVSFIANRFNEDIRILEGILNKIFFFINSKKIEEKIINEEVIKSILKQEMDNGLITSGYYINPNIVIDAICMAYGVSVNQVKSKQRQKQITFVRKVCMYVLRNKLNLSYNEIGSFFSNRDHSTVIESCKFIENELKKNPDVEIFIKNIINKI